MGKYVDLKDRATLLKLLDAKWAGEREKIAGAIYDSFFGGTSDPTLDENAQGIALSAADAVIASLTTAEAPRPIPTFQEIYNVVSDAAGAGALGSDFVKIARAVYAAFYALPFAAGESPARVSSLPEREELAQWFIENAILPGDDKDMAFQYADLFLEDFALLPAESDGSEAGK